jgi:glycosyltransferase involved in cell wall biosynthesis
MRQRIYHLLQALTRRHQVTLIMPRATEGSDPLASACEQIIEVDSSVAERRARRRFNVWAPFHARMLALLSSPLPSSIREHWDASTLRALGDARRLAGPFDLVWTERAFSAEMARRAGFQRIVVDLDDLETVRLERMLANAPWSPSTPVHLAELAKLRRYERRVPRRFARAIVCKAEDRDRFPDGGRNVEVIPNGVGDLPRSDPAAEQPGEILFVGTMHYEPNVDAVQRFCRQMLPVIAAARPDARFRIVGKEPVPAVWDLQEEGRCLVHPDVPDLTPYFDRAAVVVAPIYLGSGTRLKVLEALARGKAVVATSTAVEGLELEPGRDFELADDPDAFAGVCLRLLADPVGRARLGESGRRAVLAQYTWTAIGAIAESVVSSLAPAPG